MSQDQFKTLNAAMQGGLTHISYVLELAKKPRNPAEDVEKAGASPSPGSEGFGAFLEEELHKFFKHREEALQTWCERKGIKLPRSL